MYTHAIALPSVRYLCVIALSLSSCEILPFAHSQRLSFIPVCVMLMVVACMVCGVVCCISFFLFFLSSFLLCSLSLFELLSVSKAARKRTPLDASIQYKFKAICRLRFIYKSKIHHTRHTHKNVPTKSKHIDVKIKRVFSVSSSTKSIIFILPLSISLIQLHGKFLLNIIFKSNSANFMHK